MDFGFYYRPDRNRILFHYAPAHGDRALLLRHDRLREPDRDYIGIAKGELPRKEYYGALAPFPDTCDCVWQETRPVGFTRTYDGGQRLRGRATRTTARG